MANKVVNDHARDQDAKHEHEGSSVGFYIFIALVLGAITYVEFALVEHQETWFSMLSGGWILFWLVLLSVIKFVLVVMFFMHLKGDYAVFTGFFTSGMVIAVGTLFILSALFTVRSVAMAAEGKDAVTEVQGEVHGEEHVEIDPEQPLTHRLEYPAPKDQAAFDYSPLGEATGGGDTSGDTTKTSLGLPRAAEAGTVTLADPFAAGGQ